MLAAAVYYVGVHLYAYWLRSADRQIHRPVIRHAHHLIPLWPIGALGLRVDEGKPSHRLSLLLPGLRVRGLEQFLRRFRWEQTPPSIERQLLSHAQSEMACKTASAFIISIHRRQQLDWPQCRQLLINMATECQYKSHPYI